LVRSLKYFTATLLANFVLDNKLKLDDKINNYLEVCIKRGKQISFKELSNHTSGLNRLPSNLDLVSNPDNPYKEYDEEKLEEYLTNKLFLSQRAGEKYQYSNLGVGLLGYVLSKIDGTEYQDLLKTYILDKYNMKNSTTNRSEVEDILIKGLDAAGNETSNWDLSALTGAGGIVSTVEDLSKFVVAQFDASNKELELTRIKTFLIDDKIDIGLGWHMVKKKPDVIWHNHSGGTGGYTSSIIINVENKNGIVILSNISAFNKKATNIEDLAFDLMNMLETNLN